MAKTLTLADKMEMESEHAKSKKEQMKIVKDHEKKHGKKYYLLLARMEKNLKTNKKNK